MRIIEHPLPRPVFPGVRNVFVKGTCHEFALPALLAAFSVNGPTSRLGEFFRLVGSRQTLHHVLPHAFMSKPVFPGLRNAWEAETRQEFARKFPESRQKKDVALKKLCVLQ